jgi:hypothetical protein
MNSAVRVLRAAMVAVAVLCCCSVVDAKAAGVEYLAVPSAAMGRDIPVAFTPVALTPSTCSTRSTPVTP